MASSGGVGGEAAPAAPAGGAPASWRGFGSPTEYVDFMHDPCRVVRLEWYKVRRPQHHGLTSHSWLQAHLLDGRQMRLEFFADIGVAETVFELGRRVADGDVYDGRSAGPHELVRPLNVERLRRIAAGAADQPYSITESNCHHFVLKVWNEVVIESLQCSHYPDRVKTGLIWGASKSFGDLLFGGAEQFFSLGSSFASNTSGGSSSSSSRPLDGPRSSRTTSTNGGFGSSLASSHDKSSRRPEASRPLRVPQGDRGAGDGGRPTRMSARVEEGSRISGVVSAPALDAYDQVSLNECFARLVRKGAVRFLETGGCWRVTDMPCGARLPDEACAAWAEAWLPSASAAGVRIAQQIGAADVIDLVQRVLLPGAADPAWSQHFAPFASLASESAGGGLASAQSRSEQSPPAVRELCFVVLSGCELRLAIYALVGPRQEHPGQQPLYGMRLLSGDAHGDADASLAYALWELPERGAGQTSAINLAQEELEALTIALCTGDWGFVTLL